MPKDSGSSQVSGKLVGAKVLVVDLQSASQLYEHGFGEFHGIKQKRLELALDEAAYLLEKEKLKLFDGKRELSFEAFVKKAEKLEKGFLKRYQVYRDIRTRGYIIKTALKFGADYRVYPRGFKPGETHAKWVLFCTAEGEQFTWRQFAAMARVAHSTRKALLIAIVDAEGDVTYYEVHWKKP